MGQNGIPRCPVCTQTVTTNCLAYDHIMLCPACNKSYSPIVQSQCPRCRPCYPSVQALWDHDQVMAWCAIHARRPTGHESAPGGNTSVEKVTAARALEEARPTEEEVRHALRINQHFYRGQSESYSDFLRLYQTDEGRLATIRAALRILYPVIGPGEQGVEDIVRVLRTPLLSHGVQQSAAVEALMQLQQPADRLEAAEGLVLLSQGCR
ncbi:uncharacterized protein BDV17DRAFT_296122 [Aspergillus undulatus]|uniref:uncharacterized protein n=1 Tax=Aspergillus undulatus TaxID=1810928 RepID=UPI003CCCD96D